ncbi:asparaginase, partial [Aeromonas veronii]|nr:asparaginase [Aeromonas veronii]
IEDGNGRATYPVALETLRQLSFIDEEQINNIKQHYRPVLKNARQEDIGELIPTFRLQKC